MTVKEHCEMLAEKDGLIVNESQMIRKLEAENAKLKEQLILSESQNYCKICGKTLERESEFKGVCWDKNTGKWRAYIGHNSKIVHLGSFKSEIIAAKVYDKKARELYGEFAHTNF